MPNRARGHNGIVKRAVAATIGAMEGVSDIALAGNALNAQPKQCNSYVAPCRLPAECVSRVACSVRSCIYLN